MKRYNIETLNDDLIQIDLQGDSWVVNSEDEEVLFSIVTAQGKTTTISINMNDLNPNPGTECLIIVREK